MGDIGESEGRAYDPEHVTPDGVKAAVERIQKLAAEGQDYSAQFEEALLHTSVLGAIARGVIVGDVAKDCADLAVSTIELEFLRWPEDEE